MFYYSRYYFKLVYKNLEINIIMKYILLQLIIFNCNIYVQVPAFSSPYVILAKESPNKEEILFGAELCKSYSKYAHTNNIRVDYVLCKNVIRGKEAGECEISGKIKNVKI